MKILILSYNQKKKHNWGHTLFRESFKQYHKIDFYGPGYKKYTSVQNAVKRFKPNVIFSNHSGRLCKEFKNLNKINIPKIVRPHDYHNTYNWNTKKVKKRYKEIWQRYFQQCSFDLFFAETRLACDAMVEDKISDIVYLSPFSVETRLYKKLNLEKNIDVMASYSITSTYPLRQEVVDLIKKMPLKSIAGHRVVIHNDYINAINRSKIFVIPNGQIKSLNMKYYEILACGVFLLCQEPVNYEEQGFEEGKHFVVWNNLEDLEEKIWYYLKHENEREEIAKNGMKLIKERHSNNVRVKEWTKIVKNKFGM